MGYDEHEHFSYDPDDVWTRKDSLVEVWKSDITYAKLLWFWIGTLCGGIAVGFISWLWTLPK